MRENRENLIFPLLIVSLALISVVVTLPSQPPQAQAQQSTADTESKQTGTNLDLSINPPSPFHKATGNSVTLSFLAKTKDLGGSSITPGKIDHLDYRISITKDNSQIWSKQFHDHDGNLTLQIKPSSSGSIVVTGGTEDAGRSMTGPYTVAGPVFIQNGNYSISAQIVGIEFNPLPSPLSDNFNLQVVS
jgi:hypothetical protein